MLKAKDAQEALAAETNDNYNEIMEQHLNEVLTASFDLNRINHTVRHGATDDFLLHSHSQTNGYLQRLVSLEWVAARTEGNDRMLSLQLFNIAKSNVSKERH